MGSGQWRSILNSDHEPANARLRDEEMGFRGSRGYGFIWRHVGDPYAKIWVRIYDPARRCEEFVFSRNEFDLAVRKLCEEIGAPYSPPMPFETVHRTTVAEEVAKEREQEEIKKMRAGLRFESSSN